MAATAVAVVLMLLNQAQNAFKSTPVDKA